MFSDPKPKNPDVKVVEEVENNVTAESNTSAYDTQEVRTVEEKYKLKPEPFSLKSNEEDPELLGPQTTIDRSLNTVDEPAPIKDESKKAPKVVDRKVKQTKDKFEKAKNDNLASEDNKKEVL